MRCEDTCLLESEEGARLPLDTFLTRLRRCDGCPHASEDAAPAVRVLLARCREAAAARRRSRSELSKRERTIVELEEAIASYEARVAKLERLQQNSLRETEAELRMQIRLVAQQRYEIQELSVPIIHVWEDIFVLPVIGTLETERARVLTERLLDEVVKTQCKRPIIDVTGVGAIDNATADHLIRVFRALRLLGAKPILTGLNREVARTLVELSVDLSDIKVMRNVRQALMYAGAVGSG